MDTNFSNQPLDIVVSIVSLLDIQELDNVSEVNTTLSTLCKDIDFWRAMAEVYYLGKWSKIVYSNGKITYKPIINTKGDFFRVAAANNDIFIGIEKYIGARRGFIVAVRMQDIRLVKYFYGLDYMGVNILTRARLINNIYGDDTNSIGQLLTRTLGGPADAGPGLKRELEVYITEDNVKKTMLYLKEDIKDINLIYRYAVVIDSVDIVNALSFNRYVEDDILEDAYYWDALEIVKVYMEKHKAVVLFEQHRESETISNELVVRHLSETELLPMLLYDYVDSYVIYLVAKYISSLREDLIMGIVSKHDVLLITIRVLLLNYHAVHGNKVRTLIDKIMDVLLNKNIDMYNELRVLRVLGKLEHVPWREVIESLPVSMRY